MKPTIARLVRVPTFSCCRPQNTTCLNVKVQVSPTAIGGGELPVDVQGWCAGLVESCRHLRV